MTAYRMSTVQVNTPFLAGEQTDSLHVNTVPFGADEVEDQVSAEASMHAMAGWQVRRNGNVVVAAKLRSSDWTLVVRVMCPVEFDPADDGDPNIDLRPVYE